MSARFYRALERAQLRLQAQRARWHAFLRDQGFHLGAEDCMPDPPGKEFKPLIPRGLTFDQHCTVWRRAWARYRQSFATEVPEPPQTQGHAANVDAADIGSAVRDLTGRYFQPQTKEGVMNAAGELRDAVLGKGVTAKDTGKHVQEKAKDIFNVFQESTSAFVEGYREAVELHDKPQPAAAAGGLRAGEARPDTSTAAPAPAESPEATNDGGSWTKQGSSEVLAASSSMSDASGLGRAAENKENLENRTRAAPR